MFKQLQAHWGRGSFSNYNYHLAEHSRATEQQATTTADSKPKAAMEQSKRQREQSKRQKAASQSSVYLATAIQDEGSFRGALIGSWTEDTDIHNQQIEHLADAFRRCSFAFACGPLESHL